MIIEDMNDTFMEAQAQIVQEGISLFVENNKCLNVKSVSEGSRNRVFFYNNKETEFVLRISTWSNRTFEYLTAEIEFINYLVNHGFSASRPIVSLHNRYVEQININNRTYYITSFEKASGEKLSEMGYQYRPNVPLEEYFFNYGAMIGKLHHLSREYQNIKNDVCRPHWEMLRTEETIANLIPSEQKEIVKKCCDLREKICELPKEFDSYGLIHSDLNDSNFNINYSNGKLTVYDFDDTCYNWYMYDLANAWRMGTGWIMNETSVTARKTFMTHYYNTVIEGYRTENTLSQEWMSKLQLFLKMVELEKLLDNLEYMKVRYGKICNTDYIAHLFKCIKEDIPFLGVYQ